MQRDLTRTDGALLGRAGRLLLIALGLVAVSLLFRATGGHRARLAAEALGVLAGGGLTLVVVGVRRPSPQIVTRAYAGLGAYARALFVAGIGLLFGFGLLTASVAATMPGLREVPALGGLVTLDWVVSLTVLGTAGSILLSLGILAWRAEIGPEQRPASVAADDAILERLWSASNEGDMDALRRCFGPRREGERLFHTWCDAVGPLGTSQVLLVSSSTVWDKALSEWHVRAAEVAGAPGVRRFILLAHADAGAIASGDLYRVIGPATLPPPDPTARALPNGAPLGEIAL